MSNYSIFLAGAWLILIGTATLAAGHKPTDIPQFPIGIESFSLGIDGLCAGFGWHNADETRVEVFGLSGGGLQARPGAYDFMRPWTAVEACQRPFGLSPIIGVQYGVHPADDAMNEYAAVNYRISLGSYSSLTLLAGAFYEGWNRKRPHHPAAANWGGVFPFAAIEVGGRW